MKFTVGDLVRVRTWEDMASEFGINDRGNIAVRHAFTPEMDEYFGNREIYRISNIDEQHDRYYLEEEDGTDVNGSYVIGAEMLELVTADDNFLIQYRGWIDNAFTKVAEATCDRINTSLYSLEGTSKKLFLFLLGLLTENKWGIIATKSSSVKTLNDYVTTENNYNILCFEDPARKEEWRELYTEQSFDRYFCLSDNKVILFYSAEELRKISVETIFEILDTISGFLNPELYTLLKENNFEAAKGIIDSNVNKEKRKQLLTSVSEDMDQIQHTLKEEKIEHLEAQVEDYRNKCENLLEKYSLTYDALESAQKDLLYTKNSKVDFIEGFKNLILQEVENGSITNMILTGGSLAFNMVQKLLYIDTHEYELCKEAYLESAKRIGVAPIFDAICKQKATVIFEQGFKICEMERVAKKSLNPKVGMPNPHIQEYDCWGGNGAEIIKLLRQKDFEMAYLQIKAAIASLKVCDSAVMGKFITYLDVYKHNKCIEILDTGKIMTPEEANEYYREEFENEEN